MNKDNTENRVSFLVIENYAPKENFFCIFAISTINVWHEAKAI